MKVGSLVECVTWPAHRFIYENLPVKGKIYTVAEIGFATNSSAHCLRLEEISFGRTTWGEEFGMAIIHFRELQPPMDLTELMEETMLTTQANSNE